MLVAFTTMGDELRHSPLTPELPTGLSFVSASTGCTFASGTVTCQAGTMASGATQTFTVVAKIASTDAASDLANTATVTSSTPDPNPGNNTSTITTTARDGAAVIMATHDQETADLCDAELHLDEGVPSWARGTG